MKKTNSLQRVKCSNGLSTGFLSVATSQLTALAQKWVCLVRLQISATAATYGLIVDLFLLLRFLVGENSEVVSLFNTIAIWFTGGSLISFGLSLLAPYRRYWLAWSVPGVIAFMLWHGALFVPGQPLMPPDITDQFTVASFNVRQSAGSDLPENTRTAIENLDADLVGIQEVGKDIPLSEVDEVFPYQYQEPDIAIVSKYPFYDEQVITFEGADEKEKPVALRVTTVIHDQQVNIYVAYPVRPTISVRPLVYDDRNLKRGMTALLDALRNDPNPIILLCDCNFSPTSESYGNMEKLLNDSWRAAGFGLGLTAPVSKNDVPFPVSRGDYIWHSSEFATLDTKVIADHGASDHHPIRAELGWIVDD